MPETIFTFAWFAIVCFDNLDNFADDKLLNIFVCWQVYDVLFLLHRTEFSFVQNNME